ncbi:MAG: ABC transporter ATP-binding protein [Promethearchaeota archaeon]
MKKQISLKAEMVEVKENWGDKRQLWIKDLFHIYKSKSIETVAIKDFNLQMDKGEFLAILGPSGSGKSTLLNILGGLLLPSAGRVYFKFDSDTPIENLSKLTFEQRIEYRRKNIGYIFQEYNLFDYLTVEENVSVPLLIRHKKIKKFKEKIDEILKKCEIEHRREYTIDQLSGGEKQRVQVATALISSPKLILADEPTGNLDYQNSQNIFKLLQSISKEFHTSIIVVSHDLSVKNYCERILNVK